MIGRLAWLVPVAAVACSGPPSSPSTASPAPSRTIPPITVHDNRVGSQYVELAKRRKDNSIAYTLRADSNVSESDGQGTGRSDFTNPHIVFTEPKGGSLVTDAPAATILERDKSIIMTGGVHARSGDGMALSCDSLTYNEVRNRLHGEGHVVVVTPRGERLSGDRIDANLRLSEMQITHDRR
ncbi:MAG TPA: LPS export ABC transporter periplasmic protein LptC [Candidatus Baltobacteraceae bacterium]